MKNTNEISDPKLVVVTGGAGGGIGHGMSTVLGQEGWHVLIVDMDEPTATNLADSLNQQGMIVKTLITDLTTDQSPDKIIKTALHWVGRIDGLVNNAGVSVIKRVTEISDAEFDHLVAVNVRAIFRLSRAILPELIKTRGSIVNVSSIHANATISGYSVYAATKAAVIGLTRGLATDFGPQGVRVNCILPGLVDGPQSRALLATAFGDVDAWMKDFVETKQLLAHGISAKDIGNMAAFLLSEKARSITGEFIAVDAGISAMLTDREASS